MGRYISLLDGDFPEHVDYLVMNFVDPLADAGSVALEVRLALTTLETGVPVARVDFDPLVDYRAQRPRAHYLNGKLEDVARPTASLRLMKDINGQPFLYLYGAEPDFRWEELAADLLDVVDRFSVSTVFSMAGIPAAIPHTRQPDMIVRAVGHPSDIPMLEAEAWFPASFATFFEYIANAAGKSTVNLTVRVPVYLVQHNFSAGSVAILAQLSKMSGLSFPMGDLEHAASEEENQFNAMRAQNEEFNQLVTSFEQDYDAHEGDPGLVRAPETSTSIPSAEEIGDAAERFLAQVDSQVKQKDPSTSLEFNDLTEKVAHLRQESARRAHRRAREEAQCGDTDNSVEGTTGPRRPRGHGRHAL
ncbi:PAC2 family protein [Neoactinobaculum massilliense]|uniref:PAC2 family protein n=1 Tax=Neoactinobaculum massilliense TaxID=2364794 RepID=UPI000F52CBC0|nr:PAC2 family protein [Neoactinobaculum massilliense]